MQINYSKKSSKLSYISKRSFIELIHNDDIEYLETNSSIKDVINFFLVCFLWVLQEQLNKAFYIVGLKDLDFWTFEILITFFFLYWIFKIKIFKHQKYSIYFISIFCTILKIIDLIINIVIDFERRPMDDSHDDNHEKHLPPEKDNFIYEKNFKAIIIGILIYFFIMVIRSYSNCKIKYHFDVNYVSKGKLLLIYGIMGALISSISCTISTFIECSTKRFCKVEENGKKYYDNFKIYFNHIFKPEGKHNNVFLNILFILLLIISFSFKSYFFILIIKYLTPVHFIVLLPIYYFLVEIITGLATIIDQYKDENHGEHRPPDDGRLNKIILKLFLGLFIDFLSVLGNLVYLEIIELNFCGCNIDLRKNIIKRGNSESYLIYDIENNSFDEEDEINKERLIDDNAIFKELSSSKNLNNE